MAGCWRAGESRFQFNAPGGASDNNNEHEHGAGAGAGACDLRTVVRHSRGWRKFVFRPARSQVDAQKSVSLHPLGARRMRVARRA